MSERLCRNCKHWEKVPPPEDPKFCYGSEDFAGRLGFGVCHGIPDGCGFEVSEFHEPTDEQSALDDASAFTVDGSGFRSAIFTGPDHYCAKFEERP